MARVHVCVRLIIINTRVALVELQLFIFLGGWGQLNRF